MKSGSELAALMRDIENELIDKSHWIPRRDGVVTDHRKARGDLTEHNGRYSCATQFAFDELYRQPKANPILNADHLFAAEFFVALNELANRRSKTGYAKLTELLQQIMGSVEITPGYCALTLRLAIYRELPKWQYALCERICGMPLRTNDWDWLEKYRNSVVQSFDALVKAIELAVDNSKELAQNGGNCVGHSAPKIQQPVQ